MSESANSARESANGVTVDGEIWFQPTSANPLGSPAPAPDGIYAEHCGPEHLPWEMYSDHRGRITHWRLSHVLGDCTKWVLARANDLTRANPEGAADWILWAYFTSPRADQENSTDRNDSICPILDIRPVLDIAADLTYHPRVSFDGFDRFLGDALVRAVPSTSMDSNSEDANSEDANSNA